MPPRTPNFAAHASLDVSQGSWLLPRRSFIHQSEPGAAAVERPPARPRNARDGGAGGGDDGFGLGQGGGRTGLGGHRDGGRLAPSCGVLLHRAPPAGRPVPTEPPPRWPVAAMGPLPREALSPGCLGPPYASSELRPPGSGEPRRRLPPRPAANRAAAAARPGVGRGEAGRKGVADGLGHGCGEVGKTRGLEPLAAAAGPLAALPPPPLFCSADGGGGSPAALAYGSRGTDGVSVLQTTGWTYNLVGARRVARRARRVRGVRPRRVRSRSCRAARRRQRQAGGRAAGGAPRRRRRRAAVGEVAGARPGAAGALGSGQSGARARRRRGARGACDPARPGFPYCSEQYCEQAFANYSRL